MSDDVQLLKNRIEELEFQVADLLEQLHSEQELRKKCEHLILIYKSVKRP